MNFNPFAPFDYPAFSHIIANIIKYIFNFNVHENISHFAATSVVLTVIITGFKYYVCRVVWLVYCPGNHPPII
jgi:hypothetical protein